MSCIRKLSSEEVLLVSGGNANSNYERYQRDISGGAPASTANNAGIGSILGTIGAIAAGATAPAAIIVGAIIGGVTVALPSDSGNSGSNGRGGGWHDTNPGGMVGECRW